MIDGFDGRRIDRGVECLADRHHVRIRLDRLFRRLLPFLRPQARQFLLGSVCIVGYVLCTLALPVLAGRLAGSIGSGDLPATSRWLGYAALVFLVRSAFQYGEFGFQK